MTCRYAHGAAQVGRVTPCAPLLVGSDGMQRTARATNEEIAYRGYLLARAADIGGRSTNAYWLGIVFVSILFGYGHYYKDPAGIVDSGVAGLILGSAYMLAGRNLWASILAHGFIDTFGVIDAFFGWSN